SISHRSTAGPLRCSRRPRGGPHRGRGVAGSTSPGREREGEDRDEPRDRTRGRATRSRAADTGTSEDSHAEPAVEHANLTDAGAPGQGVDCWRRQPTAWGVLVGPRPAVAL